MAWVCTFRKDADKEDVGTASAEYQDAEGIGIFTFSRRINGKEEAVKFVADANEALTKFQADDAKNNTIAMAITNKLNQ